MSLPHPLAVSFLLIFLVSLALDFFLVIYMYLFSRTCLTVRFGSVSVLGCDRSVALTKV